MKIYKNKKILLSSFIFFLTLLSNTVWAKNIVIYGDSQHNPEIQHKIVQKIILFQPQFVFRVGDLVEDGNNPKLWKTFKEIHGPLVNRSSYFPCLGNHEFDSPLYFRHFPQIKNQRWYSVKVGELLFFILDSNSPLGQDSKQYRWLTTELKRNSSRYRFIILLFHHPIFDVGDKHHEDEKNIKKILLPLVREYQINAVFSGHSHNYQRFFYQGAYFIVTGGGGSNLYQQTRSSPYLQKFVPTFHFCLIRPQKQNLQVEVYDIKGEIIDNFIISPREKK